MGCLLGGGCLRCEPVADAGRVGIIIISVSIRTRGATRLRDYPTTRFCGISLDGNRVHSLDNMLSNSLDMREACCKQRSRNAWLEGSQPLTRRSWRGAIG